ncbi:MAG: hydroxyacid dehydrogenase [Chloroflexi bacterium]|nr:hydroxyacid dehydrogenase [Chloroflexota bacterium]MCY3582751.1 hydroxyacid dehydrogenase [Chloroflexota bacterium]MCY3717462.1 hydroxyacid dehydrogenase [Chloroflexota bacterium]MDE2652052.1 hydroxyacid dehydrogenase [Chloroflexota bacterium]MXX51555.1 hydroxyacid dehydrogenase [Chloroflexota bacterium]
MPKALFILEDHIRQRVYPDDLIAQFAEHVELIAPPQTKAQVAANPSVLQDMEILISSWLCPRLDAVFLSQAPQLNAVFYGAGTVKRFVSDAMWERGIRITHAAPANAECVAEVVSAQIVLSLKGMWSEAARVRQQRNFLNEDKNRAYRGVRGATVGIIGLSLVGRRVIRLLAPYRLRILAYDPYASAQDAAELGIELVSLSYLFGASAVTSLHAPWLPETEGMVDRRLLEQMPPYSTFINSARGALVDESALINALRQRPDVYALLDVTYPEPPPPESALYDLPNVVLTPHIAGAIGINDTRRLGECMLDELISYLNTSEMRYEIKREQLSTMA